jgi:hypothetical protein
MLSWLFANRLPLFTKTDLYAEYTLCLRMLQRADSGAVWRMVPRPMMTSPASAAARGNARFSSRKDADSDDTWNFSNEYNPGPIARFSIWKRVCGSSQELQY